MEDFATVLAFMAGKVETTGELRNYLEAGTIKKVKVSKLSDFIQNLTRANPCK